MTEDSMLAQPGDSVSPSGATETFKEMRLDELVSILDSTIICDKVNKCILFLAMLTTFTDSDQLTVCLLGPSSSGKTYLAKEIAKYFPEDDVEEIAGATPTAFKYKQGETREDGKNYIDLERVILLFPEMPDPKLLANLRPVLSHDSKETEFLSTDVGSGGSRTTKSTVIIGYPTVIFCSANTRLNEQEATRALLLSPEINDEKIEGATRLAFRSRSNTEKYKAEIDENEARNNLKRRVQYIKDLNIKSIIIPNSDAVYERYRRTTKKILPRNSRDAAHIVSLAKAVAMLNAGQRIDKEGNVIVSDGDIEDAFRLWDNIAETQSSGIVPAVLNFFKNFFIPTYEWLKAEGNLKEGGISSADIVKYCGSIGEKLPANIYTMNQEFLPTLEEVGLITKEQSILDRRRNIYRPTPQPEFLKTEAEECIEEISFPSDTPPRAVSPDSLDREEAGEIDLSGLDF